MRLYVGNLSPRVTDAELKAAFLDYGEVRSVRVVFDREQGRSRGFGFVELAAPVSLDDLQDIEIDGKQIAVEVKNDSADPESNA